MDADRVAAAAQSVRSWRIRIAHAPPDEAAASVSAALGRDAGDVVIDRQDVLIAFASEGEAVSALRSLVSAGVAVAEFAPATGSLEHTFLDLGTQSSPADPPPASEPRSTPERAEDGS